MSTGMIFKKSGRINESHTGIGPGKTRDEYLKLFSRTSYSTVNEWPHASPFAGYYDIKNSTTGLVLLNNRFKFSHLRGQILPKEKSQRKNDEDQETFYDPTGETERHTKPNYTTRVLCPRVPVDPYRHFESQKKYWHDRMCKGSHSVDEPVDYSSESKMTFQSNRPRTASSFHKNRNRSASSHPRSHSSFALIRPEHEKSKNDIEMNEAMEQYYKYIEEQSRKVGLQKLNVPEPSSRLLRKSQIYKNKDLTEGQKLYLLAKCHVYDIENARRRHKDTYIHVLNTRFRADFSCDRAFRFHDPREFESYAKYIRTPRPTVKTVNTGFLSSKKKSKRRSSSGKSRRTTKDRSSEYVNLRDFTTQSKVSDSPASDSTKSSRKITIDILPTSNYRNSRTKSAKETSTFLSGSQN